MRFVPDVNAALTELLNEPLQRNDGGLAVVRLRAYDGDFRLVAEIVGSSHGVRRAGAAALDCAYVAAGRVDAYFEVGVSAWDVAAGLLLVTEAGGRVTGWPGDRESPLRSGRVLASNGRVHAWLEEVVGRSGV